MKKRSLPTLLAALLLGISITASAGAAPAPFNNTEVNLTPPPATASTADWNAFSKNLLIAFKSDNDGLQQGALRMVIRYGKQVRVNRAVYDIMHIYREHEDDNVRRMAVVALGKMEHRWAMGFLRLAEEYEKTPEVQRTIRAVLAEYEAARKKA